MIPDYNARQRGGPVKKRGTKRAEEKNVNFPYYPRHPVEAALRQLAQNEMIPGKHFRTLSSNPV
jgi:hypothetical protein